MVQQLAMPSGPKRIEQPIVSGIPFDIPAGYIEGLQPNEVLHVQPEVVNVSEDGDILGIKIIFHLSPGIIDPVTHTVTDRVELGSLGQNDPLRMYYASVFSAQMTHLPVALDDQLLQAQTIYGEDAHIRIGEMLYDYLNISYFATPGHVTNPQSWYSVPEWLDMPLGVFAEIDYRVTNNLPLNYQFLAYVIQHDFVPTLTNSAIAETVVARARQQMEDSSDHKVLIARGNLETEYAGLMQLFLGLDFTVSYEGQVVLDDSVKPQLAGFKVGTRDAFMSNLPAVNTATMLLHSIMQELNNGFFPQFINLIKFPSKLPLIDDQVREVLIRRMYAALVEKGLTAGMSLGQFASGVYEQITNNNDNKLRDFLAYQDSSGFRIKALQRRRSES